jgi:ABC-type antimicrobial peptide transport system permease subunit
MALGATPREILMLIVRQGLLVAALGVGIGLCGAFILTRFMTTLLYGVRATDPLTFGAIGLMLGGIALLASYVPARRAARIDPMISLRSE